MEHPEEKCPIEVAISVIGTKWKVQILRELVAHETHRLRFSDFKGSIPTISDKMLSQSLKELERDHLIHRSVVDASPPHTAYSLTEMGQSMNAVLSALYAWGTLYQQRYGSEGTEDVS